MRSTFIAFLLCLAGFLGFAGLHRFYLGQFGLGLAYFFTGGFFGIGTIIDLVRMPSLVEYSNYKIAKGKLTPLLPSSKLFAFANPERVILRLANANHGVVTPQMVVMNSHFSLAEAKAELERLRKGGFCVYNIGQSGAELYTFQGLKPEQAIL